MTQNEDSSAFRDVSLDALIAAAAMEPAPVEDDPTARMLGLVPDSARMLDATALRSARRASGLSLSGLAALLTGVGWPTRTADVSRWERRNSPDVVPAVADALAVLLGKPAGSLFAAVSDDTLTTLRSSERFAALARRWGTLFGTTIGASRVALESRLAAAVHRGGEPDVERALRTLEALVDDLEEKFRQ